MVTRRRFLKYSALAGLTATALRFSPRGARVAYGHVGVQPHRPGRSRATPSERVAAQTGTILLPVNIPKFQQPLIIPPTMPQSTLPPGPPADVDYYEIAVRQFKQQILPPGLPATTVWSYGSANHPATFNYPAFTIEATVDRPVRVKWINDLKDAQGNFLPHLLAVDQTLHWANPPGPRDGHGMSQAPYTGPVPLVTHVHGAHTHDDSDGFAEAWFLPNAANIPPGYFRKGTWYDFFRLQFARKWGVTWEPGTAVFQYPNQQRPTALWYHDHVLGMTRLNVYAGPAGFYLLRGGDQDLQGGELPGPAPAAGDPAGTKYYEIPIAIQDRTFNADGSLFYPDNRAFFEGLAKADLQIPFHPDEACDGEMSDVAPIWNPEFFGNTIVVNGRTWPYLEVEKRRYRFRLLNGCNSRFLILRLENGQPFWVIGVEGGFLTAPIQVTELLMAPAERRDVIIDFSSFRAGARVLLTNIGPDEPFPGGDPGVDFDPADPVSTGLVMQFRVVAATSTDTSTLPADLQLPQIAPIGSAQVTRKVSLNERVSDAVFVKEGSVPLVMDCESEEPFGPVEALLGTVDAEGDPQPLGWNDPITENPATDAVEIWEIWNFTVDAHPIHIHEIMFEVVNREPFAEPGTLHPPEPWEQGRKDTVIAYPGQITRVKGKFDIPGLFAWHCHIVEHEDNEMMRPYAVGPVPEQQHRVFMPVIKR